MSPGPELPRPTEVGPRSEPDVRRRDVGSPAARSVLHRHSDAAAVHRGDPLQDADLPDQTQTGLHSHGHRHQVDAHTGVEGGCLLRFLWADLTGDWCLQINRLRCFPSFYIVF